MKKKIRTIKVPRGSVEPHGSVAKQMSAELGVPRQPDAPPPRWLRAACGSASPAPVAAASSCDAPSFRADGSEPWWLDHRVAEELARNRARYIHDA